MSSPKHYSTFRVAFTEALATHLTVVQEGALFCKLTGRIDSTADSDNYYIQIINENELPNNGAVTFLMAPLKVAHVNGIDSTFDIDLAPEYVKAKNGIFVVVSTTEFTKTIITSDWLSCTAVYR